MQLRELMGDHVGWEIGDGSCIQALAQPWFPQWTDFAPVNREQREVKVQNLFLDGTRQWDFQALQGMFGFSVALLIATDDRIKPNPQPAADRLLFKYSRDGKFSIKKAYQLVRGDNLLLGDRDFWNWLWGNNGLLPKFKLFIWKCSFEAIPVLSALARRIPTISPLCQLCNQENETVVHALFGCHFARSVWLASPMGLRSDLLVGDFIQIIKGIREVVGEGEFPKFMSIAWAIWRSRNGAMYGGVAQSLTACREFWKRAIEDSHILSSGFSQVSPLHISHTAQVQEEGSIGDPGCYVDGSSDASGAAGFGMVVVSGGAVILRQAVTGVAINATQAEAMAICQGMRWIVSQSGEGGRLFTDSLELANALAKGLPEIPDWRCSAELWDIWRIRTNAPTQIDIVYRPRSNFYIQQAHQLANESRISKCNVWEGGLGE